MSHLGLVTDAPENPIAVQAMAKLKKLLDEGHTMVAFIVDGAPTGADTASVPDAPCALSGLILAGFFGVFPDANVTFPPS